MGTPRGQRRIFIGAMLAVVVTGVWLWWSRRVTEPLLRTAPPAAEPFVQVGGASATVRDRVLQERAEFFDPAPLFVPTRRNYGGRGLPERLVRQPGQVFGDFEAKFTIGAGGLPAYGAEAALASENLVEVLTRAHEAPFAGFGEAAGPGATLAPRHGLIEYKHLDSGELRSSRLVDVRPPRSDFAPLQFMLVVSTVGLIGDPLLTAGSGSAEVDGFFQDYLVRSHPFRGRLAPGRYRVTIGP